MIRLVRDLETRSEQDVSVVGARRYACDPTTEVLMAGWCVDDATPRIAILVGGSDGRAAIERRVREGGGIVASRAGYLADLARCDVLVSHNQGFECAIEDYLMPDVAAIRETKFQTCTASRSRRLGLPGSLEDACKVLRTPHQKQMDGHGEMQRCAQPRPTWLAGRGGPQWFDDAERLAKVALYCLADVECERDLDRYLPELSLLERDRWLHTELVNRRGMPLDAPLIDAMIAAVEHEQQGAMAQVRQATRDPDFALTNPGTILAFCKTRGLWLADLRKETVEATLRTHDDGTRRIDDLARIVLEARRAVGGKSSVSKLPRMRSRLMGDGRARDSAIYFGAHTGRLTGDGINTLNLPRPYKKFDQARVIDFIHRGDLTGLQRDQGVSVSTAVSAALRGAITAGPRRKLVVGDYNSVEPCFSFTLAQQWDAVEVLRRRESLYIEFGLSVYNRKLDKKADLREYTICKETVLGCGYGLGAARYHQYLTTKGVDITEAESEKTHGAYRTRFPKIPETWKGLEAAAKAALRNGATYDFNGVQYSSDGWWLVCTLPSGRPFYYPNARLRPGKYDDEIVYEGWMRIDGRPAGWGDVRTWGGSLLENVTQAACRDILEEDQLIVEAQPGWEVLMTVYDEIVVGTPVEDAGAAERLRAIMERPRDWSRMPVMAETFEADRYVKH